MTASRISALEAAPDARDGAAPDALALALRVDGAVDDGAPTREATRAASSRRDMRAGAAPRASRGAADGLRWI